MAGEEGILEISTSWMHNLYITPRYWPMVTSEAISDKTYAPIMAFDTAFEKYYSTRGCLFHVWKTSELFVQIKSIAKCILFLPSLLILMQWMAVSIYLLDPVVSISNSVIPSFP